MEIEKGKFYRTRGGERVQTRWWKNEDTRPDVDWPVEYDDSEGRRHLLAINGRFDLNKETIFDIVAEWDGPGTCAIGDRVRCVAESTERPGEAAFGRIGDLGTVKAAYSGAGSLSVLFDGAEKPVSLYAHRFAKVEMQAAAPEPEPQRFKVGDRIVSIDDDDVDISPGDVFTVTTAVGDSVDFLDRGGCPRKRLAQYYRLAEPDPDFSVGDLILSVIDESDGIKPGDTFTATAIENRGGAWLVTFIHPISGERVRFAARYARERVRDGGRGVKVLASFALLCIGGGALFIGGMAEADGRSSPAAIWAALGWVLLLVSAMVR